MAPTLLPLLRCCISSLGMPTPHNLSKSVWKNPEYPTLNAHNLSVGLKLAINRNLMKNNEKELLMINVPAIYHQQHTDKKSPPNISFKLVIDVIIIWYHFKRYLDKDSESVSKYLWKCVNLRVYQLQLWTSRGLGKTKKNVSEGVRRFCHVCRGKLFFWFVIISRGILTRMVIPCDILRVWKCVNLRVYQLQLRTSRDLGKIKNVSEGVRRFCMFAGATRRQPAEAWWDHDTMDPGGIFLNNHTHNSSPLYCLSASFMTI